MSRIRRPPKNPLDHDPVAVWQARQDARLTQQDVADACDVSRSLVAEWELGTRNADAGQLDKLAAALNCPRSALERKREPEDPPPAAVGVRNVRHEERADPDDLPKLRGDVVTGGGR